MQIGKAFLLLLFLILPPYNPSKETEMLMWSKSSNNLFSWDGSQNSWGQEGYDLKAVHGSLI